MAFIVAPIAGRADSLLAGLSDGAARGDVEAHDNDFAGVVGEVGQYAGVSVNGEHDAGVEIGMALRPLPELGAPWRRSCSGIGVRSA